MPHDLQPEFATDRFGFLHIDLNSFFASVEQQLHPEYRNRPLAVVPAFADTTCCIAASYEAKDLGIRTGTQVGEAKRIFLEVAEDNAPAVALYRKLNFVEVGRRKRYYERPGGEAVDALTLVLTLQQ